MQKNLDNNSKYVFYFLIESGLIHLMKNNFIKYGDSERISFNDLIIKNKEDCINAHCGWSQTQEGRNFWLKANNRLYVFMDLIKRNSKVFFKIKEKLNEKTNLILGFDVKDCESFIYSIKELRHYKSLIPMNINEISSKSL